MNLAAMNQSWPRTTLSRAVLSATALTVLAEVAYPLVAGPARDGVTMLTVLAFCAASVGHAWLTGGPRTAVALLLVAAGGGLLVEAVGLRTGWPFGPYRYSGGLGPSVLDVPLVVPLAWAMMAWPAYRVGARLTARFRVARLARVGVAGWALASWDLFLDPQMVDAGHWRWVRPELALPGVPDVPLSNYLGWVAVSLLLIALLDAAVADRPSGADAVPQGLYLWTYASSVLAHAVFFGLPGSAGWGAAGMGLVAVPLAWSLRRPLAVPA